MIYTRVVNHCRWANVSQDPMPAPFFFFRGPPWFRNMLTNQIDSLKIELVPAPGRFPIGVEEFPNFDTGSLWFSLLITWAWSISIHFLSLKCISMRWYRLNNDRNRRIYLIFRVFFVKTGNILTSYIIKSSCGDWLSFRNGIGPTTRGIEVANVYLVLSYCPS